MIISQICRIETSTTYINILRNLLRTINSHDHDKYFHFLRGESGAQQAFGLNCDLNSPPLVEDPERFRPIRGSLSERLSSFSFPCKKTEAKVNARVPLDPARRRVGRSARKLAPPPLWLRRDSDPPEAGKQVRALYSVRPADARSGTKGNSKNKSSKTASKPVSKGLPEASRPAGGASLHMGYIYHSIPSSILGYRQSSVPADRLFGNLYIPKRH